MYGASYEMAGSSRVAVSEDLLQRLADRAEAFREAARAATLERRRKRDRERRRREAIANKIGSRIH